MYFFDIFDGHEVVRDHEGQELISSVAMRAEAEEVARELLEQTIARHASVDHRALRVRDADGAVVLTLLLRDAMNGSP